MLGLCFDWIGVYCSGLLCSETFDYEQILHHDADLLCE